MKQGCRGLIYRACWDIHHAMYAACAVSKAACCAGADEAGTKLLSKVALHAARSAEGVAVGRNWRLRLLPLPTPRWPDLLVAHSAEDR